MKIITKKKSFKSLSLCGLLAMSAMSASANTSNENIEIGERKIRVGTATTANIGGIAIGNSGTFDGKTIAGGQDSVAIGNGVTSSGQASVTLGADSISSGGFSLSAVGGKASGERSISIGKHSEAKKDGAIAIGDNSKANNENEVSFGNESLKRKITNINKGNISEKSTDAVNGSQLFVANEKINKNADEISMQGDKIAKNANSIELNAGGIVKNSQDIEKNAQSIISQGKEIIKNSGAINAQGKKINNNESAITNIINGKSGLIQLTHDGKEIVLNKTTKNAESFNVSGKRITGLSDAKHDNDAVNYAQLKRNGATTLNSAKSYTDDKFNQLEQYAANGLNHLNGRIDNLEHKINKGMAASAALSGLFQPYGVGKMNITAGVGGYSNESAVAVGMGYRFNENIAIKGGVASSTGNSSSTMYNTSVNIEW